MDPVETLRELRELAAEAIEDGQRGGTPTFARLRRTAEIAAALAEKFQELDDWMRGQRRGYSPWNTERERADSAGMPQGVARTGRRWVAPDETNKES
ncbi:MAG TPA: hypothetical protein VF516_35005 [Kofleriaceae bacterium]